MADVRSWIDYLNDHVYLYAGLISGIFYSIRKMFQIVRTIQTLEERVKNFEETINGRKTDSEKTNDAILEKIEKIEDKLDSFILKQVK